MENSSRPDNYKNSVDAIEKRAARCIKHCPANFARKITAELNLTEPYKQVSNQQYGVRNA
jgi:hypothetical protein